MSHREVQDLILEGQAAYAREDLDTASRCFKYALAVSPLDNAATVLYAIVCARTGKRAAAIVYLQNAIKRDPKIFEAHVALSTILFDSGDHDHAIEYGLRAIELRAEDPDPYVQLGRGLVKVGRLDEGVGYLNRAVGIAPKAPGIVLELATTYSDVGKLEEAAMWWQRLIELAPSDKIGWIGLGRTDLAASNFKGAVRCGQMATELDPKSGDAEMLLALAFSGLGQNQACETHLRRSIELNPKQPAAHGLLGWLLQEKGSFDEAVPFLVESTQMSPASGLAYYALRRSEKATDRDRSSLNSLEQRANDAKTGLTDRAYMYCALGKAWEDLAEYEKSMACFDEANRVADEAWHRRLPWDRERYIRTFEQTIETFSLERIETLLPDANASTVPLLIVGMMRSGTTLVEQILSSHPEIAAGGELTFWHDHASDVFNVETGCFSGDTLAPIASAYLEKLRSISPDAQHVTDKMPHNYAMLGLVHSAFPNARIIHVRRNPIDNCLSIYTTPYGHPPIFAHRRENIVCAYEQYLRMVKHWRSVLPPSRFLELDYEVLVQKPETVARKMIEFIGLEWDDACLHHQQNRRSVNTPSAWQVRQPIYRSSVERWRRFEPWIAPFDSIKPVSG